MALLIVALVIVAVLLFRGKIQAAAGLCGKKYPTPEEIAEQIFPKSKVTSTPGFQEVSRKAVIEAARRGQVVSPAPACPSGVSTTGSQILTRGITTGGSLGLSTFGASIGLAAGSTALAAATAGLGLLAIPLFGIFQHHKQAVQRENSTLCDVIPSVNQLIAAIMSAYRKGEVPAQQAIDKLQELEAEAESALGPIKREGTGTCNAACVFSREIRAAIAGSSVTIQKEACL